jgi:hypothetical protein
MKLIIENCKGFYAYFETEKRFKRNEKHRGGVRVDPRLLDEQCDLSAYGDSYMVIDVKPRARKKKRG